MQAATYDNGVEHAARSARGVPARARAAVDFDSTPFTIIWEATRACDLRCVHCRADAQSWCDPLELSTTEAFALLDQVHAIGSPVFVITGGDPLKRGDLFDLISYGVQRGIGVALTPSGTPLLTRAAVERMKAVGVSRIALSLDGHTPALHDSFRCQPGSYGWTTAGIGYAEECGLPVQVNTTVTRRNLAVLPEMARLVGDLGAAMWSVFFLVTVGRAQQCDQLTPEEFEDVFAYLYEVSRGAPFAVRSTAAPQYRRFVLQRETEAKRAGGEGQPAWVAGMTGGQQRAPRGVTDGKGLVFVSHTGDVYPSGFLPLSAGNVRRKPLAALYREAEMFCRLRDIEQLEGKCGVCEFRNVCGGSRARAFAVTGNYMAADPCCAYQPRKWRPPPVH